jgi:hypothetical protein
MQKLWYLAVIGAIGCASISAATAQTPGPAVDTPAPASTARKSAVAMPDSAASRTNAAAVSAAKPIALATEAGMLAGDSFSSSASTAGPIVAAARATQASTPAPRFATVAMVPSRAGVGANADGPTAAALRSLSPSAMGTSPSFALPNKELQALRMSRTGTASVRGGVAAFRARPVTAVAAMTSAATESKAMLNSAPASVAPPKGAATRSK